MDSEAQVKIDEAIVAMDREQLAAAVKDWGAFIKLPWATQQRLEQIAPDHVKKLKDRFFSPFGPLGVGR